MRWPDLLGSAVANTRRARIRTALTVLAVFIGAFALTLTSGMGTGVNRYIDDTVAAFGDSDALYVQKSQPLIELSSTSGPREYDPDSTRIRTGFGVSFEGLTPEDIAVVEGIDGVRSVKPMYSVAPTYLEASDGSRFQLSPGIPVDAVGLQMVAGGTPWEVPESFAMATVVVEDMALAPAVQERLEADDMIGLTVQDQLGMFRAVIDAVAGVAGGSALSAALSGGFLSGLPGLSLFAFESWRVALIVLSVMGIAFLAGTVPAVRAARKDPIASLRHE